MSSAMQAGGLVQGPPTPPNAPTRPDPTMHIHAVSNGFRVAFGSARLGDSWTQEKVAETPNALANMVREWGASHFPNLPVTASRLMPSAEMQTAPQGAMTRAVLQDAAPPIGRGGIGFAIAAMHAGNRVARRGWNGRGMWLFLVWGHEWLAPHKLLGAKQLPFICMKTADHGVVPWLASQSDLLCEDWVIVND